MRRRVYQVCLHFCVMFSLQIAYVFILHGDNKIKAALSTPNLYFNVCLFIDFSYYHQLGSFDM